jgi:hypothetical protein
MQYANATNERMMLPTDMALLNDRGTLRRTHPRLYRPHHRPAHSYRYTRRQIGMACLSVDAGQVITVP